MPEETTIQSMFTNYALQTLFPDWEAHPEHARRISMAHLGLHLDPAEALSPEDTEVKDVVKVSDEPDAAPLNITDIGVSVSGADDTTAKVTVVVEIPDDTTDPRSVLRGKTVREIGLFVNIGTEAVPDWKMVWLSDLPAMYVPTTEETGIAVSFTITVPIRFDNASQISLITDNDSLAARIGELETEVGGLGNSIDDLNTSIGTPDPGISDDLWTYVETMNGPGDARRKADASQVGTHPGTPYRPDLTLWEFASTVNASICPIDSVTSISSGTYSVAAAFQGRPAVIADLESPSDLLWALRTFSEPEWNFASAGKYFVLESMRLSGNTTAVPLDFKGKRYWCLDLSISTSATPGIGFDPWSYLRISMRGLGISTTDFNKLVTPLVVVAEGYSMAAFETDMTLIFFRDEGLIKLAVGLPSQTDTRHVAISGTVSFVL